ncbi:MAG: hypothetical protein IT290_00250, partial [Deltaproteobacteria bacterium]|nr:hypothetical protein [Deltaproteobacteria bacterium]
SQAPTHVDAGLLLFVINEGANGKPEGASVPTKEVPPAVRPKPALESSRATPVARRTSSPTPDVQPKPQSTSQSTSSAASSARPAWMKPTPKVWDPGPSRGEQLRSTVSGWFTSLLPQRRSEPEGAKPGGDSGPKGAESEPIGIDVDSGVVSRARRVPKAEVVTPVVPSVASSKDVAPATPVNESPIVEVVTPAVASTTTEDPKVPATTSDTAEALPLQLMLATAEESVGAPILPSSSTGSSRETAPLAMTLDEESVGGVRSRAVVSFEGPYQIIAEKGGEYLVLLFDGAKVLLGPQGRQTVVTYTEETPLERQLYVLESRTVTFARRPPFVPVDDLAVAMDAIATAGALYKGFERDGHEILVRALVLVPEKKEVRGKVVKDVRRLSRPLRGAPINPMEDYRQVTLNVADDEVLTGYTREGDVLVVHLTTEEGGSPRVPAHYVETEMRVASQCVAPEAPQPSDEEFARTLLNEDERLIRVARNGDELTLTIGRYTKGRWVGQKNLTISFGDKEVTERRREENNRRNRYRRSA